MIQVQDDDIFARWNVHRPDLVRDGIVDGGLWLSSPVRTVFVLKEVHAHKHTRWDLRDFLAGGARNGAMTWNNVTRWVLGGAPEADPLAPELRGPTQGLRAKALRSICVVNLKKNAGGGTAKTELGVDVGPPRLPWPALDDEARGKLRSDLERLGFFEWRTAGEPAGEGGASW